MRVRAVLTAGAVAALFVTGCSSSGGDSNTPPSATTGRPTGGLTPAQIQWAADYIGSKPGKADSSLSPVVVGYVNQQGGTLQVPEATTALDATLKFINDDLGGINGHPVVAHKCFTAAPEDAQKCATQMANDSAVKSLVVPLQLQNNNAFYSTLGSTKPILNGTLVYPIDFTTPNVYSFGPNGSTQKGQAIFAINNLHAKRIIYIRTDNPPGLASQQAVSVAAKQLGTVPVIDVPVPEPGTAPQYSSAIAAASPKDGDVIALGISGLGGPQVYDALKTLNITNVPVIGSEEDGQAPFPDHLKQIGAKDTVYPDGWYLQDMGYTVYMPEANTNGVDVYIAMMNQFAPDAAGVLSTFAPISFSTTLMMARFMTAAGGANATPAAISQKIKDFTGPALLVGGDVKCGAAASTPNLCAFNNGFEKRKDGKWISIADGLNGKLVDTLPLFK